MKKLQEKLNLKLNKEVLDIIQFGSSIQEGKTLNDIDVAVIYNKIPLKEQLQQSQEIKEQLEKRFSLPIHIKSYDLYSFFDKGNFAKDSILSGKSLISGDYFSKIFGIIPKTRINYSLNKLQKKDKVRFNYLLSGKGKKYGLLRNYGGKLIAPGIIEINPEFEKIFTDAIKEITSEFSVQRIYIST